MASSETTNKPATAATPKAKRASPVKNGYLILYNAVSAILWATVLGRTVGANLMRGPPFVFLATGSFVKWTQTLMVIDVLHAALGIVRSSPVTAGMQVASRFVAVWGVQVPFPGVCASPIYSTMLLAWSLTEVLRYGYLALKLAGIEPAPLVWIRYSSYKLLYPLGILSEMGLMWLALSGPAGQSSPWGVSGPAYQAFLAVCLFGIWPWGAYVLIGHMNATSRRMLAQAGKARGGEKATQ